VRGETRAGRHILEGSDTPISISLTEAGRYVETDWHMTGEELSKLKLGDPVIIHRDSGERRPARYMDGEALTAGKSFMKGRPSFPRWC
jgi:hypothetical protein